MKKKKLLSSILIIVLCLLITGCGKETKNTETIIESNGKNVDLSSKKHKICKGDGHIDSNSQANMIYDIYYKDNIIYLLKSQQQIISSNKETLDTYEQSFKGIASHYEGLEYYDTEITKTETSVNYIITINYEKIDTKKLIEIEGEEDNIFDNGYARLDKWVALSSQFGVTCEEAEDV